MIPQDASPGFCWTLQNGDTQDYVLGDSQPSLAGLVLAGHVHPALACWATLSRPFGTYFWPRSSHADSLAPELLLSSRVQLRAAQVASTVVTKRE
jgi:hypothetical protein